MEENNFNNSQNTQDAGCNNQMYNNQNQYGGQENGGSGLAVASMVLGIISLVFSCCFYYISFPCAIIGLILGGVSMKNNNRGRNMAIAGMIMSAVSILFAIISFVLFVIIGVAGGITDMFNQI